MNFRKILCSLAVIPAAVLCLASGPSGNIPSVALNSAAEASELIPSVALNSAAEASELIPSVALNFAAEASELIPAVDSRISVEGVLHIYHNTDGKVRMNRIDNDLFGPSDFRIAKDVANTQSGVRIIFRTDSPEIRPVFETRPDAKQRGATWFYGVYCDGKFLCDVPGPDPVIKAPSAGMHEYRIVLPIMNGEDFCGIRICDGARLKKAKAAKRPVYFAIGDSITHGTGQVQHGSQISYPFIVAENHGFYLYNLAVGGSKITPRISEELKDVKADVITIMWGFNDWNSTKGDIAEIAARYKDLLHNILEVQPEAEIYCILPCAAKVEGGKPGYRGDLPDVRAAEKAVIESYMATRAGKHIHLLDGSGFSTPDDLIDGVHFSNEGAARYGAAISEQIR